MGKVAVRGLFARKLRLALTVLAVVLGTTLIAGTYVFTDSINGAFDKIFTTSNKGTDAAITPHQTIDQSNNGGTLPTVPASVLEQVRNSPGVATAEGSIFDAGTILGNNGKRIGSGGAPNFIASIADVPRFQAFTVKEGRKPTNANEATIDQAAAKPGVSPQQLKNELRRAMPRSLDVRTGAEQAAKQSKDIRDNLGFLKTALFAFAGISLFVGAFLIFNTFSITVAQRMREFALLRTLGASRR